MHLDVLPARIGDGPVTEYEKLGVVAEEFWNYKFRNWLGVASLLDYNSTFPNYPHVPNLHFHLGSPTQLSPWTAQTPTPAFLQVSNSNEASNPSAAASLFRATGCRARRSPRRQPILLPWRALPSSYRSPRRLPAPPPPPPRHRHRPPRLRRYRYKESSMSKARNALVATGLLVFAGAGLSFPFLFVKSKNRPIIDSSKPLPPQATFRGPYVNTGSHDIGPDSTSYPKK
ncbi:hypothetical protein BS78_06G025500 [Paspalum vaginatum]|nr:hypothetical protein BS78_06G025500 [Paspalum vaginatum]KAJ1270058.1 hypothetical protein BS78_06G025500 [Paspalum vaginatum]KAJ1270059.1 hypothetical protein BS78_06G025500 [Paspalum vaginatum]